MAALAAAAHLSGRDRKGFEILARAHQAFEEEGKPCESARCAFWLGFISLNVGEEAQASGWLSRAARIIEDQPDCVERGYLLLPEGIAAVRKGNAATAKTVFTNAVAMGQRFGDKDLVTLALQGQGRALICCGTVTDRRGDGRRHGWRSLAHCCRRGVLQRLGLLPRNLGPALCQRMDCGAKSVVQLAAGIGSYRGNCQLHRAEVLQLSGSWSEALGEAQRATEKLADLAPKTALGAANYRVAEISRVRG